MNGDNVPDLLTSPGEDTRLNGYAIAQIGELGEPIRGLVFTAVAGQPFANGGGEVSGWARAWSKSLV